MNVKLYKVGGAVRDSLLGIASKDIDFAVEAPSYDAMKDYILANGKIFLEKPEYLTIRAKVNNLDADFVLCRKDGAYSDGRRPDEVTPGTILDDLSRRDFTVNAIAQRADGSLYDPFNGQEDLTKRRLRCVGNAKDRFSEDALRMLRAMRFHITKGMYLDDSIESCLVDHDMVERLETVSVERIREELFRCFKHDTINTLAFLRRYKALSFQVFSSGRLWLVPTIKEA